MESRWVKSGRHGCLTGEFPIAVFFSFGSRNISNWFEQLVVVTRSRSSMLTPSRAPVSISWRRTHTLSVCGSQQILGAIDQWLLTGMGTRHGVLAPYAQRVHGLSGKTSLNSYCLHLLEGSSLLKVRGNSIRRDLAEIMRWRKTFLRW